MMLRTLLLGRLPTLRPAPQPAPHPPPLDIERLMLSGAVTTNLKTPILAKRT